ncbi:MAG: extracellular solute-binding protein [Anaerolineae bacterium]|nr:extracellular solute-binding protein [Anaerolineae bacterium]
MARNVSRRDFMKTALAASSAFVAAPALKLIPKDVIPYKRQAVQLTLWAFVNTHARWFRSMAEDYKKDVNPDFEIDVQEIAYENLHDNLLIALQSGGIGAPDIADIEQGRFGGFLRGGDPGLVDILPWLEEGGYLDQLVASREALYSYQGKTYGIEHALTPVVLYYRADVFEEAGIDVASLDLWDDFIEASKQLASDEVKVLSVWNDMFELLLRQRGLDYFDADGNVTVDDPLSIDTMEWMLALTNEHGIAEQEPEDEAWWAAVREGRFLGHPGADWYAGFFKDNVPELSGMWGAVPLPRWEPGGSRTSCWGGTGACIVATSPNVEEAWKFLQYTMLSVEGNVRRYELTTLFPPFLPAMDNERLFTPDEYFGGQELGRLFAEVAPEVPAQYQSPYRTELQAAYRAVFQDLIDGNVTPEEALTDVANDIREVMEEEGAL